MNQPMFKALRQGLLLLISFPRGHAAEPLLARYNPWHLSDGEIIAVDFGKDGASFIYKVRRVAQP